MVTATAIPAGYAQYDSRNNFVEYIGPLYFRDGPEGPQFGFLVEPRHCNMLDIAHGGLLSAFADIAITRAVAECTELRALTLSLNTDFIGAARRGAWVESRVSISKRGGGIGFATCEVLADGVAVVHASAAMKYIPR